MPTPYRLVTALAALAMLLISLAPAAHAQTAVRDSVQLDIRVFNTSGRNEGGNGFCAVGIVGVWPNVLQDLLGTPERLYGYNDYTLIATEGFTVRRGLGEVPELPPGSAVLGHNPDFSGSAYNFNPEGPIPDCSNSLQFIAPVAAGGWTLSGGRPYRITDWYAVYEVPDGTPIALFEWEQTDGLTVAFDGFAADLSLSREVDASAPGGKRPVVSYAWEFGDGASGAGAAPTHAYDEPGDYAVTLTVTDDDGEENARTDTVTVAAVQLTVVTEASVDEASAGEAVEVVATITNTGTEAAFDIEVPRLFTPLPRVPDSAIIPDHYVRTASVTPVDLEPGEATEERRTTLAVGESIEVRRTYFVETAFQWEFLNGDPSIQFEAPVEWQPIAVIGFDDEGERAAIVDGCDDMACVDTTLIRKTPLVVRPAVVSRASSRRDTLVVRATVENTGSVDLRDVRVPAAFTFEFAYADSIDVGSVREPELSLAEGEADTTLVALPAGQSVDVDVRYVVDRVASVEVEVAPGETETVQVLAEVTVSTEGIVGFSDNDLDVRIVAREEDPTSCPFDPGVRLAGAERSRGGQAEGCPGEIQPGPDELIVNATTNNNDEEPGDGICSTGETVTVEGDSVDECTFRAAWQEAAAAPSSASLRIDFNIPGGGGDGEPHVLDLSGDALPPIQGTLLLNGASQPDGVPIEVDGSGLAGDAGLVMNGAAVENLAFYSFPGTVLTLNDDINIITDNRFGMTWNDVSSPDLADVLRNDGDALVVNGDDTEIRDNLIVGSRNGIRASGADSLRIVGNQVGDVNAPNRERGILIENAFEPRVGSFTNGEGNVIAYNLGGGVKIDGDSPRIVVAGNEINDNRGDGLWVRQPSNPSFLTVIGGGEADQGNRITQNDGVGVRILGPSVSADGPVAVSVQSNVIEDNRDYGIVLEGGSRVRIGGEVGSDYGAAPGNLISSGISLASGFGTTIQGNVVSNLDDQGVSTADPAIQIRGSRNVVGGDDPLLGNAIVGTPDPSLGARGAGILNEGTETLIAHNFIGTDGRSAQGFANGLVLRTSTTVQTNVISGNAEAGVLVESGSATLTANLIGTDAEGRTAVPNGGPGIDVTEGSATIGGEKEGEACEDPCNVISGNDGPGILVRVDGSAFIQGNVIGGALSGQRVLGNGGSGIELHSDGIRIGGPSDIATLGTCSGPCNRIVGNGGDGIRTFEEVTIVTPNDPEGAPTAGEDGASGIVIQGNAIGGDLAGAGNQGSGVAFGGGGQGNVVGGGDTGAGNRIVGNGRSGVALHPNTAGGFFAPVTKGLIRENVIYGNQATAIDLNPDNRISRADGWSRLDAGDEDEGPNDIMNWPYLVESRRTGPNDSELLVLWTGEAGTYSLDVYASGSCVSGSSAAIPVTTRSVSFDGSLGETVLVEDISTAAGSYLTATIRTTGADGITSEVSNCRRIGRRGTQANANVDPEVATAINDVIVTLRNATPVQPGGPLRVQGGSSQTLLVAQFEEGESSAPFEEASAQAPSGASVTPRSTSGPQWEVTSLAGDTGGPYDLCLRADGLGGDAERAVLVAAAPETNGRWRPFDTRIDTVDSVPYACADGVLPGGAYTLATADAPVLVAPALLAPADGATDVALTPTLTWSAVLGAERYDVQLDSEGTFETPDAEQTGVEATAALFEELAGLTTYAWRVRATSAEGVGPWSEPSTFATTMAVGTEDEAPSGEPDEVLPSAFALDAYPNPARGRLTVAVALAEPSRVRTEVYDLMGRRIATLHEGTLAAGTHPLVLDTARMPAGVYVVRAATPEATLTRRLTVVR